MPEMNDEPPLVIPQDGSPPYYTNGFQDLKVGDVFTICGMPPRRVVEGPTKSERGGWRIRAEAFDSPPPPSHSKAKKGPLVFPPNGLPFRRESPASIQVGDIYAIGSEPTRIAVGAPEQGARGWKIPSKPALPHGFIEGERGGVKSWVIRVDPLLLTDSGVASMVDIAPGVCTVKGTFAFSTLQDEQPVTLSPTFRLATNAGAVFLNPEEAKSFLDVAVSLLNKRYHMSTAASYLSIGEVTWRCTPGALLELLKWSRKTRASLERKLEKTSQKH